MEVSNLNIKNGLCISLGANIDSKFGKPIDTLLNTRPKVENLIKFWVKTSQNNKSTNIIGDILFFWSSLYETSPHGISDQQPNYINTLVVVKSNIFPSPSFEKAKVLLRELKILEVKHGREHVNNRKEWLPRSLDLDILWWENLYINDDELTLPHPRFMNRNFVITPLSEVLGRSQNIKRLEDKRWEI